MRAELERRVAELDKRQSKSGVERRGSVTRTDGSGGASPFRGERAFSQQSSADLDRSLMQVTHSCWKLFLLLSLFFPQTSLM